VALSFAVVCESPADRETACDLADRVFCEGDDWIEEGLLDHLRQWRGWHSYHHCLCWKEVPALAREHNIKPHGHFDGKPGAPDAHVARQALLLLNRGKPRPHGVILIRDTDNQTARRQGLEQARDATQIRLPIVIGLAHTKRECWVLAGFEPRNEKEAYRLQELEKELGFNPCTHAEKLTATDEQAKRSAKRVLQELCGKDRDRECTCWRQTDLARLEERGQNTGLGAYLQEIRERIRPLLGSEPAQ
jgi:hypothetical protein